MDEPFKGLDKETKTKVMDFVISKLENKGAIIITHDMDVAKLADRVIEVLDGQIISAGDDSLIHSKIDV